MPWKETCQMDERTQFIARVLAGEDAMTTLCREYGISRKTGYKWLGRYRCDGAAGLRERSHAPLRHGQAHDVAVVQAVVNLRERWGWGPKKLRVKLGALHPEFPVPAASTIGDWLRHEGLVGRSRRRRRCPAYAQPFAAVAAANDVWCTDFKSPPLARTGGWFRTGDGRRCDPFTLSDAHSRYLLRCQAVARPDEENVRPIFEAAFREHGLPQAIRSDNGPPFASPGVGGPGCVDCRGWRSGGSSSASRPSGSSPASRSRMGVTSGSIVRSRKRPQRHRQTAGRRSNSGSTTSEPSPTTSGRTRRWARRRRRRCTSRRRGPTRIGSPNRATAAMSRSAGCAATARSNGRAS